MAAREIGDCTCQEDPLDTFFRSIAKTMRSFPQADIAELKMLISNAVGEKEIALSEKTEKDVHYVIAVNSVEGQELIPVQIQHVDYEDPSEENGNIITSHDFIQLRRDM